MATVKDVIGEKLYLQAIGELEVNLGVAYPRLPREGIEKLAQEKLANSWEFAVKYHDRNKSTGGGENETVVLIRKRLKATNPTDLRYDILSRTLQTNIAIAQKCDRVVKETHRETLITFFTMDHGVSRTTAEQIVDDHLLS